MEAILVFPESEEGMSALRERVAEAHAAGILRCIELRARDEDEKRSMLEYLKNKMKA